MVGVPGRVVKRDNVRFPQTDLDQVHMPDPVLADIEQLKKQYAKLYQMFEKSQMKTKRRKVTMLNTKRIRMVIEE